MKNDTTDQNTTSPITEIHIGEGGEVHQIRTNDQTNLTTNQGMNRTGFAGG